MATTAPTDTRSSQRLSTIPNESTRTIWHKSAPKAVRHAFSSGRDRDGWTAWVKYLARRSHPVALSELVPGKKSPLLWVLPDGADEADTRGLIAQIDKVRAKGSSDGQSPEKFLFEWRDSLISATSDACCGLEALAWCHALPRLTGVLPPEAWWDLLGHLLELAADGNQIDRDTDPLPHQLLAGELPMTLAYLFPEITPCRKLAREAKRVLSAGLVDLLDGEGLPNGKHLGLLRLLLACWTRCQAIGKVLSKRCVTGAAQTQYEWLVRHALRLTRRDGTLALSRGPSGAWCRELFEAALLFGGDEDDRDIATLVLPGSKKADVRQVSRLALPDVAVHSEWSGVAVLRPGWSRGDPRLVVAYGGDSVRVELGCRREVLCSGLWGLKVACEGRPLGFESEWEEICWTSDDDADYLELEINLEGGLRVQRHMLLAREDRFLLLADAILGSSPASLEYCGKLPLFDEVTFQPADETRECLLLGQKREALVAPLALPEWQCDERIGSLACNDGSLELRQAVEGRSMFAPLFFDLDPRRMAGPLTWRQLTVAENLEVQPADVAVGYRMMVDAQQWLIYRSLTEPSNRTLLGHNLSTGMLVARFDTDGEIDPLIEIE